MKHTRYMAAAIAAVAVLSPLATATRAFAVSAPLVVGADGVSPTFGKARNGVVAEFWPEGNQIVFRTVAAGAWSSAAVVAMLPAGVTVASTTAAVGVNNLGNLEVYIVASDAQTWHSYAANGASDWSAWSHLGMPNVPIARDISVGTNYAGNQELYVRATNGEVFHKFATPGQGSGWSGWDSMGQPSAGVRGDVSVGKNSFGNQELYIVGGDGRPYHDFATPGIGSGWNGWDPLDGPVTPIGNVSAAINYAGNQELYFVGSDGNVWHNYATPGAGSGWAGWSALGAPAGVAVSGDASVQPHDFAVLSQQWIRVADTNGTVWQDTQTPGAGSGWSGWGPPTTPTGPPSPPAPSPVPTPTPPPVPPPVQPGDDPRFGSCKEAVAHGYGPYVRGVDPEYAWYTDADHDGIVCER